VIDDPLSSGAVHDNSTCWLPGVADRPDGLPGVVEGVVVAVVETVSPLPALLVAETRKSQETPFVSGVTVAEVAPEVVVADDQPLLPQFFSTV
jgi:hypothetical protein